eukprot:TRINITY_DN391_c0_g1_i1.p3 TRINITY_DN391_c0_g1~~TRINITY_DN391_c0_g1_i1.p3  ORF type:complete len:107 (+),score=50.34 TRINITY_DN391_c0_g1_i1:81-401(+)
MSATQELACSYASLVIYEDGAEITAEKIAEVCKAAGVAAEPYYTSLFAEMLSSSSLSDLLSNVGSCGGGGAAAPAAGGDAAPKEEAKAPAPVEESEEEDTDFGLFD